MVGGVQGPGSPQDKELYQQEMGRAVSLFHQSLAAYQTSQLQSQKDEFKDVMKKALVVIHQTIPQVLGQELAKQKEMQLTHDYQKFLASDNAHNVQQLQKDLNGLG